MNDSFFASKKFRTLIILVILTLFAYYMILRSVNSDGNSKAATNSSGNITNNVVKTNTNITSNSYKAKNSGVSYTDYYIENSQKKPIIILQHGLAGNKKDFSALANRLATEGFYVICPDAYSHGNTNTSSKTSIPEIVYRTANNFTDILNHFTDDDEADTEKIGIGGFSIGSLAAYYYGSYGSYKVTAIVACCGTPDNSTLIGKDIIYNNYFFNQWEAITDETQRQTINNFLLDNNPVNNIDKLKDISILMQIGGKDTTVTSDGCYNLYEKIKGSSSNSLITLYPDYGHEITASEIDQMINYFVKIFQPK